ncbi:hypothetical protein [Glycomyces sp. MUSA5-2]|uniref:hypothetical protein n=1 Tax=Glycomyces sp. MUSA5-2 TaxID=2053002 RepID=UPI003009C818
MTTQTLTTTAFDPAALYTKWTDAAADARWRFRNESVTQVWAAEARATAWSDGAANVYVADDLAAYLTEQITREDIKDDARATYADMLNDLHASRTEVAQLRAHVARLEDELAELRARLDGTAA